MAIDWQSLDIKDNGHSKSRLSRARVFGGWLVTHNKIIILNGLHHITDSMSFVPDPEHEWEI
jgi:hypothetical protein